jgi:N-acetylmuramoyl-L-alanine amidase
VLRRSLVEFKAAKIQDPVRRLQYLRERMKSEEAPRLKRRTGKLPAVCFALLLTSLLSSGYKASQPAGPLGALPVPHRPRSVAKISDTTNPFAAANTFSNVWLVDKSDGYETYSNGLKIDDHYAVSNENRLFYPVYQRSGADISEPSEWRSEPAGIVYHTTETDQARFAPDQTPVLKRIGKEVLTFVEQNRSYHFLIDRFGQVFRIVHESDIANHAGNSVWADDTGIYVNLNSSFLGIAFETQTERSEDLPSANPAQIHSARVLTEMLRSKYHIPATDCVTHAQVSVNPSNMLIGYHTDWAGNFPFSEMGLPDNYQLPPPSIYIFGFSYDTAFVHATGARLWEGLSIAEDRLRSQAIARRMPESQYRSLLEKNYKDVMATLKAASAAWEKNDAT